MKASTTIKTTITLAAFCFLLASYGMLNTIEPKKSIVENSISISKKKRPGEHGIVNHALFSIKTIVSPDKSRIDEDVTVKILVTDTQLPYMNGHVVVRVEAPSFEVSPKEPKKMALKKGEYTNYILSPKATGNKKIRTYAIYVPVVKYIGGKNLLGNIWMPAIPLLEEKQPEREQIIDIEVYSKPKFLGLGKEILGIVQAVSAILGFPAIIMLIITRKMEKKKEKDSIENKSKIILQ